MADSIDTQIACIFMAQHDFVKGLAIHYAPWPGFADDIVQQVFLEFIAKKDQWTIQTDICPLLASMTRNVAKRYWKEKMRKMPEALRELAMRLDASARQSEPEERYEEKRIALNYCLDQLPSKSRTLIDLRYFGLMTPTQIAENLHLKISSVNQALYRAREKLHACITRKIRRNTGNRFKSG